MNVGIIGASGYVGLELLRLLALHPHFKVTWVTSREHQGKAVSSVHTALRGVYDIPFADCSTLPPNLDIVFLAVPHGESMRIAAELRAQAPQLKIIDLGSDFRLDAATYEATYHHPHTAPALLETAVYGTPEICPERIAQSTLVANPGCFAHCIILATAPLARARLIDGRINIAAVTGSSGSGAQATPRTHHPERNESLSAYQVLKHRHVPEIETTLSQWERPVAIDFVPISGPLSRGIFATSFVPLTDRTADIESCYAEFAEMNPFIRIRTETPRSLEVRGSNFVDISVHRSGNTAVIVSTLDNLVKGAGGNAIQSANLMSGLPPTTGLLSPPLFP
jgi:N-acetyl-gamma-glutamyl-phosphate reductase common form